MDRADKAGLSVAAAAHVLLFGALSLGWLARPAALPPPPPAIDVSLVDKVDLQATAPQSVTPPAQSVAPELGAPEQAPATPPDAIEPDPAPPVPQPKAAPPPKPSPAPPQPKKVAAAEPPKKAETPPKREAAAPAKSDAGKHARGSSLGDIMKGIGTQPAKSVSQAPQAATMSAQAAMDIGSKIKQQVQPCANRQIKPGPGAERIVVAINLKLNRDGSLAANPRVIGQPSGVDDENGRYAERVIDNAIATFKGCSPIHGLPLDLYDVPNGWSNFTLRYKLPG